MWTVSLLFHLVGNVGYNLLLRKSAVGKIDKWLLATILQTGICIPAIVIALFFRLHIPSYSPNDALLFVATVLFVISFHFFNVKSLQYLEASVYSVVYGARILTVSILGTLFLTEKLTPLQLIGGLLIFCSVFIVRQGGTFEIKKIGLFFGFGTTIIIAFLTSCEKILYQHVGFLEYFVPLAVVCQIIMWTIVFIRRTKVSFSLLVKPVNLSLMGLRAMSAFGLSYSLIFGPIAISNYISSLGVVLTVGLGALFLHERDFLKSKILAAFVACIGLTLILFAKL